MPIAASDISRREFLLAKHADHLIRHGYELFPLKSKNKRPLLMGWRTAAPLTAEDAARREKIGVRLTASQLVIDVDWHEGRPPGSVEALALVAPEIWTAPMVDTPHGIHIYLALPDGFSEKLHHVVPNFQGTEFKTVGRYVVAPDQAGYQWSMASGELPAPVVPDSILKIVVKPSNTLAAIGGDGEWSLEELAAALDCLDPMDFRSHDEWFSLMCACHEATHGMGLEEFTSWSVGDEPYRAHANKIRSRWRSLEVGKPGNAGPGTLMAALAAHGVDPPVTVMTRRAADDFAALGDADGRAGDQSSPSLMNSLGEKFKVVDESGKFRVFAQRHDDILKRDYWVRYQRQDFLWVCKSVEHVPMVQCGQKANGDPKFEDGGLHWLDHHRKKKTYGGVVYAPEYEGDRTPDGRLNIWRGFAVTPSDHDQWEYLKELVWDNLCARDHDSYEYVMSWLARAVQRPEEPGGVAAVFKGPKGTGKSTLGSTFCRMFGPHGMQITSPSLLTGRFNAHLRDISALFADEAFWAGDKNGEGVLKGLVTETSLTYEGKGANAETGRNCVHLMMASNEDWVVPAGLDKERRFAVFEVEPDTRDKTYWDRIRKDMSNGGLARMLWDLKSRDISEFDVFRVPQTRALFEQKVRTMEPCEAWLLDLLDSGQWGKLPCVERQPDGRAAVLTVDMKNSMLDFYRDHNRFRPGLESIERHLGVMLKKMLPSVVRVRVNRPDNRSELSDRPWAYILPSEPAAREEMQKTLGSHASWDI